MKLPFGNIFRVIKLLEPKERVRLAYVIMGAVLMAIINVIGIGSIMPFIAVASKPQVIQTNKYLSWAYSFFGFSSDTAFLIFLGIGVVAFLVLANGMQAFLQFMKVRFTSMRRHTLSMRLLKTYLGQSYPFFLSRNSYEFVKNINNEISQMVNGTLIQFVDFLTQLLQVVLLIGFLFAVDTKTTFVIVIVVGGLYAAIYGRIKKTIRRLGVERYDLTRDLSRIVNEAFWGIKEVKIFGCESAFGEEYSPPSRKLARNASTSELVGDIPKFILETAAFSTIMVFVLVTIIREGSFADAAGTVTLFAYAGYRLIPAVQSLFKSLTKLKYGAPTADRMIAEFTLAASAEPLPKKTTERMPFTQSLELRNIGFSYPNIDHQLFSGLNLSISANSLVGFAGKTGSGKTTLVDIILGLLIPQEGEILVDGRSVASENLRSWQANLGYVPQNIYLSNTSLAANIAFGIPRGKIDMEMVERAARMAQLHDFVVSELKEGYHTFVGERGIRLSGGQRQRVGIARALYRNPEVLVMDEATSALDNQTEHAVMEAIDALMGTKTIILIAHRLTTLTKCDAIYILERGKIVESGGYSELSKRSAYFA
jgi:ABC-type multidrug transport system fused ATPase/permease subunit